MTDRFEQFTAAVSRMYRCIQRIKSQEMDEFGLRGGHVTCLYFLGRHPGGLTSAELSAICGEDKAAVSRTVGELEDRGLISLTSTADKKRYRAKVQLTQSGEAVARRMDEIIVHIVERADRGLSEEERTVFYRAFAKISDNLQAYAAGKEAIQA